MTEKEQTEMARRKAMRRRQTISATVSSTGKFYNLPALSTVQRVKLIDHLMNMRGDLPNGFDLRVILRYVNRGFFDTRSREETGAKP